MSLSLAPIVLFVYNRPWHTRQTVEALQKNKLAKDSELIIYSDGSKNDRSIKKVKEVRGYIRTIDGFKNISIVEQRKNKGLANSIIDGVTEIVNKYGKIIVLEDDLVTSPYFLRFMNNALTMYEKDSKVASIHGYIYPIKNLPNTFFLKGADCWGWSTWRRAWRIFEADGKKLLAKLQESNLTYEADFQGSYPYVKMLKEQINGKNDSWAVRWYMSAFLQNMFTLYPGNSLVKNIGLDNSGVHSKPSPKLQRELADIHHFSFHKLKRIEEDEKVRNKIISFLHTFRPTIFNKMKIFFKQILK